MKKKWTPCPECKACFLIAPGEAFPPHRAFRGAGRCGEKPPEPISYDPDGLAKAVAFSLTPSTALLPAQPRDLLKQLQELPDLDDALMVYKSKLP